MGKGRGQRFGIEVLKHNGFTPWHGAYGRYKRNQKLTHSIEARQGSAVAHRNKPVTLPSAPWDAATDDEVEHG